MQFVISLVLAVSSSFAAVGPVASSAKPGCCCCDCAGCGACTCCDGGACTCTPSLK